MLFSLPAEVMESAMVLATPTCVSSLAQTCRYFRNLVYGVSDQYLWRSLFLEYFDDPRLCITPDGLPIRSYDWAGELQKRWRIKVLAASPNLDSLSTRAAPICDSLLSIIYTASPRRQRPLSKNISFIVDILSADRFRDIIPRNTNASTELRAQSPSAVFLTPTTYHDAHLTVFDLEDDSHIPAEPHGSWGPYLQDGSDTVDWAQLAAARCIVERSLGRDHEELSYQLLRSTYGCAADNIASTTDWAGVTGQWS